MVDKQKELKELCDAREKLSSAIQNDITATSVKIKKLFALDLEIYGKLPSADSLFNDSPISHFKTAHQVKQFMIKRDMDFIGYSLDGKQSIKDFLEYAKEITGWIMRCAIEKPKVKKGIDAITGGQ